MKIRIIKYFKCGERYEAMIDHLSLSNITLTAKDVCITWMVSFILCFLLSCLDSTVVRALRRYRRIPFRPELFSGLNFTTVCITAMINHDVRFSLGSSYYDARKGC